MDDFEAFKPKSETDLRKQVREASTEAGEELLSPEEEELFELLPEELKKRHPDRYAKYVEILRTRGRKNLELKEAERAIDARLQELFIRHTDKINEGNSGFILKVNIEDIQPELIEDLKKRGIVIKDNQVAKILKLYRLEDAKREFELQKKAFEAVEAHADDPAYAKVPRPYFAKDLALAPKTRDLLKAKGVKVGDRVGVIMMDFVPRADDLAAKLFKEVMRRSGKLRQFLAEPGRLRPEYEEANFHRLPLNEIAEALGYFLPGGKGKSPEERERERQKVFDENEELLITFLEEHGFQIHPAILEQIRNTLEAFHRNQLVFRDGHHRNFMIEGDLALPPSGTAAETPRVTVIDFGGSATFAGDYAEQGSELYADRLTGKRYKDDYAVVRELEHLAVPPAEREAKKKSAFMDALRKAGAAALKKEPWRKFQEELAGIDDPEELARFIDHKGYRKFPMGDERISRLLGLLVDADRADPERLRRLGDALMKLKEAAFPREQNIILKFLEELGYRQEQKKPPAGVRGASRRNR